MSRFSEDELMQVCATRLRERRPETLIGKEGMGVLAALVGEARAADYCVGIVIGTLLCDHERNVEHEVADALEKAGYGDR